MISAVNSIFSLDNIYCFRYRVKLNNPLTGTETPFTSGCILLAVGGIVKLNNPLTGTETV